MTALQGFVTHPFIKVKISKSNVQNISVLFFCGDISSVFCGRDVFAVLPNGAWYLGFSGKSQVELGGFAFEKFCDKSRKHCIRSRVEVIVAAMNGRMIVGCLLMAAACSGCGRSTKVRYKDQWVKVEERSVINFLNVHASKDTAVLTIWGKEFKDVRGLDPCYLKVPNSPLILFVTGRSYDNGEAEVHLANTSTKEIQSFSAGKNKIGDNIGSDKPDWFERVASVTTSNMVIEAAFLESRFEYLIDLSTPRFVEAKFHLELTNKIVSETNKLIP